MLSYDIIPYRCQRARWHLIHNRIQKYTHDRVLSGMKMDFRTVGLVEPGLGESVMWGEETFGWALEPWLFETGWRTKRTEQRELLGRWGHKRVGYTRGQEASHSGMSKQPECSWVCSWVCVGYISLHYHAATHLHMVSSKQAFFFPSCSFLISSLRISIFIIYTFPQHLPDPLPLPCPHNLLFSLPFKTCQAQKAVVLSWVCGFPLQCRQFSLRSRRFSCLPRSPL